MRKSKFFSRSYTKYLERIRPYTAMPVMLMPRRQCIEDNGLSPVLDLVTRETEKTLLSRKVFTPDNPTHIDAVAAFSFEAVFLAAYAPVFAEVPTIAELDADFRVLKTVAERCPAGLRHLGDMLRMKYYWSWPNRFRDERDPQYWLQLYQVAVDEGLDWDSLSKDKRYAASVGDWFAQNLSKFEGLKQGRRIPIGAYYFAHQLERLLVRLEVILPTQDYLNPLENVGGIPVALRERLVLCFEACGREFPQSSDLAGEFGRAVGVGDERLYEILTAIIRRQKLRPAKSDGKWQLREYVQLRLRAEALFRDKENI